jgi:methylated-DNA-[protein]-cysteine S-methyltransferase
MLKTEGFTLFDTPLGHCGIAWGSEGQGDVLTGVQLPGGDEAAGRARMQRRFPGVPEVAPPPWVAAAITRICATLAGEPDTLADLPLCMAGVAPFHQQVYAVARAIAPGQTLTYGEVAAKLGQPGAARAVGQALGHNPFAPVVPCHRVLAAGQRSGGFSATGGVDTKLRMLLAERAQFGNEPGLF